MALPLLYRPTPATIDTDIGVTLDGWTAGTHQSDVGDSAATEWWIIEDGLKDWNGTPDVRLNGIDRPLDHGQFDAASFYGSRVVTINGVAICPDKTSALLAMDVISSVAAWDPSRLYLMQVSEPGRPTRRAMVRLNTATKVGGFNGISFDFQLQVKAPDPRKYDDTESTIVLQPPTGAAGGITVPVTVPFSISTVGLSTSAGTAVNNGTFPSRPVVTFAGPLVDPVLANLTAGKALGMTITLAAGDTLVADFDRRTLILNGSASRATALTTTSAWWELGLGGNDLMLTAGGGDGTATIRWRSATI